MRPTGDGEKGQYKYYLSTRGKYICTNWQLQFKSADLFCKHCHYCHCVVVLCLSKFSKYFYPLSIAEWRWRCILHSSSSWFVSCNLVQIKLKLATTHTLDTGLNVENSRLNFQYFKVQVIEVRN